MTTETVGNRRSFFNLQRILGQALFRNGFCYSTVNTYEGSLTLKYLRHLAGKKSPIVNPKKIGGIGHSHGSANIVNLLARIEDGLAFVVSDHTVNYLEPDINWEGKMYGSMAPGISLYDKTINDFSTLPFPTLQVGHDYYDWEVGRSQIPEVFDFLKNNG
ncbi:MAG: hypothetical protein M5R36_14305 [Deltaproteobacteria bacterium]|nr:hypothetical protein [Deltaproteobacteria bacterium]